MVRRVNTSAARKKIMMRDVLHALESDHLLAKSLVTTKAKAMYGLKY